MSGRQEIRDKLHITYTVLYLHRWGMGNKFILVGQIWDWRQVVCRGDC